MSKNSMGYMGPQVGKLGTAVGFRWRGKDVYRAYQKLVSNPRTEGQQLVRAKFSLLSSLGSRFQSAIDLGYAKPAYSAGMTNNNMFMQENYSHVTGNTPETLEVSLPAIEVSKGNLPAVNVGQNLDVSTPSKVTVNLTSTQSTSPRASLADKIYAFAYCPAAREGRLSDGVANRSATAVSVENLPNSWSGLEVYVYVFVIGNGPKTAGVASQTVYAGCNELA